MEVMLLRAAQWPDFKKKLLAFARRYGDSRLTAAGLRAMNELEPSSIDNSHSFAIEAASQSTASQCAEIAIAHHERKLAGFAFSLNAGENACLVVVHPQFRGLGIGSELLRILQKRCHRLTCHVATDNPASMGMCFRAGMKAVSLEQGPTGKPSLRFQSDEESCTLS